MSQRPLVSRTLLILILAAAGVVLAGQTRLIVDRFGQPTYFVLIGFVAIGLAALARPRPR